MNGGNTSKAEVAAQRPQPALPGLRSNWREQMRPAPYGGPELGTQQSVPRSTSQEHFVHYLSRPKTVTPIRPVQPSKWHDLGGASTWTTTAPSGDPRR